MRPQRIGKAQYFIVEVTTDDPAKWHDNRIVATVYQRAEGEAADPRSRSQSGQRG